MILVKSAKDLERVISGPSYQGSIATVVSYSTGDTYLLEVGELDKFNPESHFLQMEEIVSVDQLSLVIKELTYCIQANFSQRALRLVGLLSQYQQVQEAYEENLREF